MYKMPKISVIIPIYNAEKYLKECFCSVLNQTEKDIEIICIDDGSTDRSKEIINEFKKRDGRIKTVFQKNKGSGLARNEGIEISIGEYLAFLDADDYYPSPNTLETMYKKASRKNAQICGGALIFDLNGKTTVDNNPKSRFKKDSFINYADYQWSYGYYRFIFKSDFIKKNQIRFPNLLRYQDPPFLLEAMLKARSFYAISDKTYCHRLEYKENTFWNDERTNDLVKGILLCIKKAKKAKAFIEISNQVKAINEEYLKVIKHSLLNGNEELIERLAEICFEIDYDEYKNNINNVDVDDSIKNIIEKKVFCETNPKNTKNNNRTRRENVVKNLYYCLKENGTKYTIKRILFYLRLADDNDVYRTYKKNKE